MVLVSLTMNMGVTMRCVHDMLDGTCAICLNIELPSSVAEEDFRCGQCGKMVWKGEFYSVKETTWNGIRRQRRVGGCCADE